MYNSGDIVLINFPFTNLIGSKIRLVLVIAERKEDVIVLGIFSKVPDTIEDSWFLLEEYTSWFTQTGLKKRSIIKTEKIAVIHNSIAKKKLGKLPDEILVEVKGKLRKALNI